MQRQMSGAPSPRLEVQPPAPVSPKPAAPSPAGPRSWRWLVWLLGMSAAIAVGVYLWNQQATASREAAAKGSAALRTATIGKGNIIRTIRLTGTTGAERFVALVTPQLRGRGDGRREASEFQSGQNTNRAVQSNARRSSSSSSASSSSSSGADSSSGGNVQSTMGQSNTGGSAAFQASTSRVTKSSTTARSSSSTQSGSGTTGSGGLGSTSGSLFNVTGGGGGGGGGGGRDFMLTLQKLAKPGSSVKKGEVIAEFDRVNMMNRVDDFRAAVAQTEASFTKMAAELEVGRKAHGQTIASAKADLDKARLDLKTTPVLSAIEAERARLALEETEARYKQVLAEERLVEIGFKAQLRNAEIELQQARIDLRRAEANADRMVMRSPLDGLAVLQNTFRGSEFAQIQEGDQLYPGMMFVQVVDPSSMVVNATVNQVDVEQLRIGLKAKVRFDAYPGLELAAHIFSIGAITRPGGPRAAFVKEVPLQLKLDSMDPRVIPDLSVSCDVIVGSESAVALAPKGAVFSDDAGRTSYLFVRSGDAWEKRTVELGLSDHLAVAVRSGVRQGEVVAVDRPPEKRLQAPAVLLRFAARRQGVFDVF